MICSIKALLGDYLDRELHPDEKKRVESHLGECSGCRAELDELKSLSNMIGGLPQASLPSGFMTRLERRRVSGAPSRQARPWRLPVGARTVAFAAASLLVTLVVYDRAKVMLSPGMIAGAASALPEIPEDQLRLSTPSPALSGLKSARAVAKNAKLARAPGAPLGVDEPVSDAKAPAKTDLQSDSAQAAQAELTNERLQADLRRQERLMGVRGIVAPDRHPMGEMAVAGGVEQLAAAPSAAQVGGQMSMLLQAAPASVSAGRGAAMEPPAPAPSVQGVVVRSETQRQALWSARGMKAAAPTVDWSKRMLVVVFGTSELAVEIDAVTSGSKTAVVKYRQMPLPPGADDGRAVPYQFRAVPRADDVSFEKLP